MVTSTPSILFAGLSKAFLVAGHARRERVKDWGCAEPGNQPIWTSTKSRRSEVFTDIRGYSHPSGSRRATLLTKRGVDLMLERGTGSSWRT